MSAVSMTFAGNVVNSHVGAISCEKIIEACFAKSMFGEKSESESADHVALDDIDGLSVDELEEDAEDASFLDIIPKEILGTWKSVQPIWEPVRASRRLAFNNYAGLLTEINKSSKMQNLMAGCRGDKGCEDSVAFLSFLYFINNLSGSFNKNAIVKGLISLRTRDELRDDRFIVVRFDAAMRSGLKGFFPKSGGRR